MKLVVSGSRSIKDAKVVYTALLVHSESHDIQSIITGGAKGVDRAAMNWAMCNKIHVDTYLPNYALYGRIAPLVRNEKMATVGDELIAIWDGKSKGTMHAVSCFRRLDKRVYLITIDGITRKHTDKEKEEGVAENLAVEGVEECS